MSITFEETNAQWVYANNYQQALDRINGIEVYDPWFSEEGAVLDKDNPDCVRPGEKLYRIWTQTVIHETDIVANPK